MINRPMHRAHVFTSWLLPLVFFAALAQAGSTASPADALAHRVHQRAGGDRLDEVSQLGFRFVVLDGGKRKFEAMHRWDLRAQTDRVSWTDGEGRSIEAMVNLPTRQAEIQVDGIAPGEAEHADLTAAAYRRWVNDSYWLMLPLKLLDPGVQRTLEAPRELDGKRLEVLELTYGEVGLTPGDTYWLFIDPATDQIVRWEMVLEGRAPPPKGFSWVDYRAVGPLTLAHDHMNDDASRHILFEDVQALVK